MVHALARPLLQVVLAVGHGVVVGVIAVRRLGADALAAARLPWKAESVPLQAGRRGRLAGYRQAGTVRLQ